MINLTYKPYIHHLLLIEYNFNPNNDEPMLRRHPATTSLHSRIVKNKETQLLVLLERCTRTPTLNQEIPKDDRLIIRDRVKAKD